MTGWGRLSESGTLPHVLQHLTLPILSLRRCHTLYRKAGYTKYIHNCQLCSGFEQGGLDSCQVHTFTMVEAIIESLDNRVTDLSKAFDSIFSLKNDQQTE